MLKNKHQAGKELIMIFRTRGYLPHLQTSNETYFVTFRIEDSLPKALVIRWKNELEYQKKLAGNDLENINELQRKYFFKVDDYLDKNQGSSWLKDSNIAKVVAEALKKFDGQRYSLHAWTIMPNHVHVLISLHKDFSLGSLLHSWKSFTANQANQLLGRSGSFWQREYYDRAIRSERQFEFTVRYIFNNPVKAGLCKEVYQWPWSGCSEEILPKIKQFFLV
jgi:REP element-mobilizing transposase RayT